NMTTLNFALSRTVAREWSEGDEVVVTRLDHDGNVSPWLELAHDLGLIVRFADIREDTTLDLEDLAAQLTDRTRVVAFPWASNAVGTLVDVARVAELAHEAGALAWVDAVHYGPHGPIDVAATGADVLICSPYKFYGLHGMDGRVSTFAFNVEGRSPRDVAVQLGERGIAVWQGNYYAVEVMKRLGLDEGAVRAGIVHYNTTEEVDRLLAELERL